MHLKTIAFLALSLSTIQCLGQDDPHADPALFQSSENCIVCHSNLYSASGEDVSIGYSWRASMMANSARDPYWQAAVRREITDHPQAAAAIEDKCSTCHMPMMRFTENGLGNDAAVFATLAEPESENHLAMDGVSCTVCHQIQDDNFGLESSFTGGFLIDRDAPAESREVYGPYDIDKGRQVVMQSSAQFQPARGDHIQRSELCATCHTLYTESLDGNGNEVGQLAEQVPYLEWLYSDFRETQSCQSCHMPQLEADAPISSVLGEQRDGFSQHVFRGGNAFMLRILAQNRDELDVPATREELEMTAARTVDYLGTHSAGLAVGNQEWEDDTLQFTVSVSNLAGHKLPTAYPSRRVWLHVTVLDGDGAVVFESGAVNPDGSITGNDNDSDPTRFEPHYELISAEDQVQIYEPVLVDYRGRVTTGLLYGVAYAKDNRLLPRGFDKHGVPDDIGVFGAAAGDDDFAAGSDRVRYRIDTGDRQGPFTAEAVLNYQSIGFRWAENLRDYDNHESERFLRYYDENSADSPVRLSAANAIVQTED